MNYFIIFLILYAIPNYSKSVEQLDIRGYQFGEIYSYVLSQEKIKQEYTLQIAKTNNNRLVYQGILLNKSVCIAFHFRSQRLSSISYIWKLPNNDILFYRYLKRLLNSKYTKKNTGESSDNIETTHFVSYSKDDKSQEILSIFLEFIKLNQDEYYFILEFYPYDSDEILKNKILLEDI